MNRAVLSFVFAGLISTVVADALAEEVCYTPVRGSASTTNVNPVEQLGEYVVLMKRSGYVADTRRYLRLKGELRGIITNPEEVNGGALPELNHVLRSGSDLIFTSNDTLNGIPVPVSECYVSVSETLRISEDPFKIKGTGQFANLVSGEFTVEGEIFNANNPACLPEFIGSANEFEILPAAGGLCFTVD